MPKPRVQILSEELMGFARRMARGLEVTPETLAAEVIQAVGPGGSYLAEEHTVRHFRRELWIPGAAWTRQSWDARAKGGRNSWAQRAAMWFLTPTNADQTQVPGGMLEPQDVCSASFATGRRVVTAPRWKRARNGLRLLVLCALFSTSPHCLTAGSESARTVPTFHCMSLYWPRPDGALTHRCDVRYRKLGAGEWREGHELWWDEVHQFYAGAVNGRQAGILAVAASDNPRAVWAHARDYGFLALNPTGPPPGAKDVPSLPFTLAAGESLRLKFGFLLHSGSTPLDAPRAAAILNAELTSASQPDRALAEYRAELQQCRDAHGGSCDLPDVKFFLFGMGGRAKLFYRGGALFDARDGRELRRWPVKREIIVPPDYAVHLETEDGKAVVLREDAEAVWLEEGAQRTALANTKSPVKLPDFAARKYPRVLRVLHQELLVNIVEAGPVPNLFVYAKPWYRDGAMVALALKETGNLDLLKPWILGLREPFDRNNQGETEADNLGQALFLISLVADANHPLVTKVLAEVPRFGRSDATGTFISGRSDFADHPVYQTKWLKFGLKALGLPDGYVIPKVADSYGALFWMDYRDQHVAGRDSDDRGRYPYLGWACDHFHGTRRSPLSNRDYPLTWEAHASEARYDALNRLAPVFAEQRISPSHTWHAAEAFLLLLAE